MVFSASAIVSPRPIHLASLANRGTGSSGIAGATPRGLAKPSPRAVSPVTPSCPQSRVVAWASWIDRLAGGVIASVRVAMPVPPVSASSYNEN